MRKIKLEIRSKQNNKRYVEHKKEVSFCRGPKKKRKNASRTKNMSQRESNKRQR